MRLVNHLKVKIYFIMLEAFLFVDCTVPPHTVVVPSHCDVYYRQLFMYCTPIYVLLLFANPLLCD